jgi:hypothetical protein
MYNWRPVGRGCVPAAGGHSAQARLHSPARDPERILAGVGRRQQRAEEAQRKLENAGMELGLALVSIALRGGGGAPSSAALFDSVDGLAEDPDVRRALERLDVAEVLATDVHDRVEAARAHLGAAALLRVLKVEGGGDEVAQREHSPCCAEGYNGVMELHLTESKAVELVGAIVAAMKEAFGVSAAAPTDVSCL